MQFITRRSTAVLSGAVLALGAIPGVAFAAPVVRTAPAAPPTVTIVSPATGARVGGAQQRITIKAPVGTTSAYVVCDSSVDVAPFAPSTWAAQASDGTMTGTVDLTHCTNGANGLRIDAVGPNAVSSTSMPVTIANPGTLAGTPALTSTMFSPDGDHLVDTVNVHGGYVQADRIIVRVRDARGRVIDTLTTQTWLERMGLRFYEATWDGRTSTGRPAPQGTYTLQVIASSKPGGTGATQSATVRLVRHHKGQTALKRTDQAVTFDLTEQRMYFQGSPSGDTPVVCRKADGTIAWSSTIGSHIYGGWAPLPALIEGHDTQGCTVSVTTASGIRTDLPRSAS